MIFWSVLQCSVEMNFIYKPLNGVDKQDLIQSILDNVTLIFFTPVNRLRIIAINKMTETLNI